MRFDRFDIITVVPYLLWPWFVNVIIPYTAVIFCYHFKNATLGMNSIKINPQIIALLVNSSSYIIVEDFVKRAYLQYRDVHWSLITHYIFIENKPLVIYCWAADVVILKDGTRGSYPAHLVCELAPKHLFLFYKIDRWMV